MAEIDDTGLSYVQASYTDAELGNIKDYGFMERVEAAVGGAAVGAAIGAVVGGPIGAAIGAVIGGLFGGSKEPKDKEKEGTEFGPYYGEHKFDLVKWGKYKIPAAQRNFLENFLKYQHNNNMSPREAMTQACLDSAANTTLASESFIRNSKTVNDKFSYHGSSGITTEGYLVSKLKQTYGEGYIYNNPNLVYQLDEQLKDYSWNTPSIYSYLCYIYLITTKTLPSLREESSKLLDVSYNNLNPYSNSITLMDLRLNKYKVGDEGESYFHIKSATNRSTNSNVDNTFKQTSLFTDLATEPNLIVYTQIGKEIFDEVFDYCLTLEDDAIQVGDTFIPVKYATPNFLSTSIRKDTIDVPAAYIKLQLLEESNIYSVEVTVAIMCVLTDGTLWWDSGNKDLLFKKEYRYTHLEFKDKIYKNLSFYNGTNLVGSGNDLDTYYTTKIRKEAITEDMEIYDSIPEGEAKEVTYLPNNFFYIYPIYIEQDLIDIFNNYYLKDTYSQFGSYRWTGNGVRDLGLLLYDIGVTIKDEGVADKNGTLLNRDDFYKAHFIAKSNYVEIKYNTGNKNLSKVDSILVPNLEGKQSVTEQLCLNGYVEYSLLTEKTDNAYIDKRASLNIDDKSGQLKLYFNIKELIDHRALPNNLTIRVEAKDNKLNQVSLYYTNFTEYIKSLNMSFNINGVDHYAAVEGLETNGSFIDKNMKIPFIPIIPIKDNPQASYGYGWNNYQARHCEYQNRWSGHCAYPTLGFEPDESLTKSRLKPSDYLRTPRINKDKPWKKNENYENYLWVKNLQKVNLIPNFHYNIISDAKKKKMPMYSDMNSSNFILCNEEYGGFSGYRPGLSGCLITHMDIQLTLDISVFGSTYLPTKMKGTILQRIINFNKQYFTPTETYDPNNSINLYVPSINPAYRRAGYGTSSFKINLVEFQIQDPKYLGRDETKVYYAYYNNVSKSAALDPNYQAINIDQNMDTLMLVKDSYNNDVLTRTLLPVKLYANIGFRKIKDRNFTYTWDKDDYFGNRQRLLDIVDKLKPNEFFIIYNIKFKGWEKEAAIKLVDTINFRNNPSTIFNGVFSAFGGLFSGGRIIINITISFCYQPPNGQLELEINKDFIITSLNSIGLVPHRLWTKFSVLERQYLFQPCLFSFHHWHIHWQERNDWGKIGHFVVSTIKLATSIVIAATFSVIGFNFDYWKKVEQYGKETLKAFAVMMNIPWIKIIFFIAMIIITIVVTIFTFGSGTYPVIALWMVVIAIVVVVVVVAVMLVLNLQIKKLENQTKQAEEETKSLQEEIKKMEEDNYELLLEMKRIMEYNQSDEIENYFNQLYGNELFDSYDSMYSYVEYSVEFTAESLLK